MITNATCDPDVCFERTDCELLNDIGYWCDDSSNMLFIIEFRKDI